MSFKPRYIKAQEAEERIVALWRKEKGAYADMFNTAIDACQTIILDMYDNSSQDVVSVVRCKDCKHRDPEDHKCDSGALERAGCIFPVQDDYFCSCGERREDGKVD